MRQTDSNDVWHLVRTVEESQAPHTLFQARLHPLNRSRLRLGVYRSAFIQISPSAGTQPAVCCKSILLWWLTILLVFGVSSVPCFARVWVGAKQLRTSVALSLTQNWNVRGTQGLIRGSLVFACLHMHMFVSLCVCVCVVRQYASRYGVKRKHLLQSPDREGCIYRTLCN